MPTIQQKLESLMARKPAMSDVPLILVNGVSLTPRQALQKVKSGIDVQAITNAMIAAGYDPPQLTAQDWKLAEDYYKSVIERTAGTRRPVIASIGTYPVRLTYEQALREIQNRTPLGEKLVKAQLGLLSEAR